MRITVAQRFRPYTHRYGSWMLIPGTWTAVQVFPALLRVGGKEIPLDLPGPHHNFTACQDLEKGGVVAWGKCATGPYRYYIGPEGVLTERPKVDVPSARLVLGSHKAQNWERIWERRDLSEIFPLWHRLGHFYPPDELQEDKTLLRRCQDVVQGREHMQVVDTFRTLFLAGIEGILTPKSEDIYFQGFSEKPASQARAIISQGSRLIERLFFEAQGEHFFFLPTLHPHFHAGRMLNIPCGDWGSIDLEWSKKLLKKVIFRATKIGSLNLHFQKVLQSFRCHEKKGTFSCHEPFEVLQNSTYTLDCFTK